MTGVVSKLFGTNDNGVAAALASQQTAQRTALASATNTEADTDQQLAIPRRRPGGRNLLTFLAGGDKLGG